MAELSLTQLNKLVKSDPDITQSAAAAKLNVPIGKLSMLVFCQAKVAANPGLKAPGTATSVKKLRDGGDRWELIAARTGLGVAAVKAKYEEAGGDAKASYTGRGRNFSGSSSKTTARSGSKTKAGSKTKTAAGRSGSKTKAGSKKTGAKSKTRAGIKRNLSGRRSQASGNPS